MNIRVKNLVHGKTSEFYSKFDSSSISDVSIVIHNKYVHTFSLSDVPTVDPKIIPTDLLNLYISEKNEYSVLNAYLEGVSVTLPIFVEIDLSFIDNLEATKETMSNLFTKNVVKIDVVMEMQDDELIQHFHNLIKESKTVRSVTIIVNQDPTAVIDLIQNAPRVEQWIMDIRKPWEEKEKDLCELFRNSKNNSLVLRDVYENLLEFRYPTSFEVRPVL